MENQGGSGSDLPRAAALPGKFGELFSFCRRRRNPPRKKQPKPDPALISSLKPLLGWLFHFVQPCQLISAILFPKKRLVKTFSQNFINPQRTASGWPALCVEKNFIAGLFPCGKRGFGER